MSESEEKIARSFLDTLVLDTLVQEREKKLKGEGGCIGFAEKPCLAKGIWLVQHQIRLGDCAFMCREHKERFKREYPGAAVSYVALVKEEGENE